MKDLLGQKTGLEETALVSPILLMLQAEKLKNRGCGITDYDYVDYYRDGNGDINGLLDQIVITPDGGYYEDYDWNTDDWGQGYPDDDYASDYEDDYDNNYRNDNDPYNGGSGSNGSSTSEEDNIETGRQFVDSLQNGDVNVTLSSELLSNLAQVGDATGFTSDVLETLKGNSGLLGTIGTWLSRYALGYSTISVIIGLNDGERSPRDWVNFGATVLGWAGIWVPPLGAVSFVVAAVANAVPGDQGRGQGAGSHNGQY